MAKKTKVTGATFNLNQKRVDEIASALRVNAADINVDVSLHNDAKDAAKAAGEVVNSKRVDIMFVVADLAEKNNWHPEEVKSAVKDVVKGNGGPKAESSVKTFLYEICYAAHPAVRDNFRTLVDVVNLAWENEAQQVELNDGAPRPIAKWAKRKYHAITGAMKAAINDGILIQEEATLIDYAIENDPDHNVGKVFTKLENLLSKLQEFHTDFPVDDIGVAIESLQRVTVEHVTAAQARKNALTEEDVKDIQAHTPVVTTNINTSVVNKPSPFVTVAKPGLQPTPKMLPIPVTNSPKIIKVDVIADVLGDDVLDAMDVDSLLGDNLELAAA